MSDTELMDFIRHFVDSGDWATWLAIADRFADEGDSIGYTVASLIPDIKPEVQKSYESVYGFPTEVSGYFIEPSNRWQTKELVWFDYFKSAKERLRNGTNGAEVVTI